MKMINGKSKTSSIHTIVTFKALVDANVGMLSTINGKQENGQSNVEQDSKIYEYQIWTLDHSFSINILKMNFKIRLSNQTAKVLDIAAKHLIYSNENKEDIDSSLFHKKLVFASLAPSDRLRAVTLLEQQKINLKKLPLPFWNNSSLVSNVIYSIGMASTIGYYSGWTGSCFTDMEDKPQKIPLSWKEIGYPGRSRGYHALRGYLIEKFNK